MENPRGSVTEAEVGGARLLVAPPLSPLWRGGLDGTPPLKPLELVVIVYAG